MDQVVEMTAAPPVVRRQSDDPAIHARRWWILAVLCLALLIVGIDGTIVNVALPTFVRELGATTSQLQWISDAYTLAFASLLLTAGTLSDRFGRKGALLVGLAVFGLGSLASAFAGSADALIATRAVQGVGSAFIMPATLSILTNVFDDAERGRAIGVWAGVSGLGVAIGPVTGGWLLDHYWWGSIFLLNLPIVVVAVIATLAIVPTSKDPSGAHLDLVGTALSIGMLVAILYGIIEGPSRGWTSAQIVGAFVIGGVLLLAFVLWELHVPHPMLDVSFFANPRFSAASVAITLVFFAMFGSIFFLSQYLQFVLAYTPLQAGVRLIPVAVALMIAAPLSSLLVARFGTKIIVTVGLVTVAGALFLLSRASVTSGYELVAAVLVVLGLGMGIAMAPATDSIMGSLPLAKAGVGSAVNDTTREIGGALGVAVLGSIMASGYSSQLADAKLLTALEHAGAQGQAAADAVRSSIGGASIVTSQLAKLEAAGQVPAGTVRALTSVTNQAFITAMDHTVVVGGVVALLGALVALVFLPARPVLAHAEDLDELRTAVPGAAQDLPGKLVPQDPARPAVAGAVLRLLAEAGFSSLNFHGVATRAGVSTASIERYWSSKVDLVVDALRLAFAAHPVPDTGSLVVDCRTYLADVGDALSRPELRAVVAGLVNDAVHDPELAEALRARLIGPRHADLTEMVRRGEARGEVAANIDADVLVDTLIAPIYHRVLVTGEPVDRQVTDEIVSIVLVGAGTDGSSGRHP
jgi:EmrB/QacA subfamily drug resistance transporter